MTCEVELPVDEVQVLISPAARLGKMKKHRVCDGFYYLALLDRTGKELCSSAESYEWEKVIKLASYFKGKSVEHALEWWRKRRL